MSGEYFCVQEIDDASKFCRDFNNNATGNDDSYSITSRQSQDVKLHEMEEQLEIAENRCNTLKDQLDQMKKLYQNKNEFTKNVKIRMRKTVFSAISDLPARQFTETNLRTELKNKSDEEKNIDGQRKTQSANASPTESCEVIRKKDDEKENIGILPMRQNSQAIGTDNSGAAVQTINNILTGITNSVNRLSELHLHLEKNSRPSSSRRRLLRDSACGDDEPMISVENIKYKPKTRKRSEIPRNLTNLQEESQQDNDTEEVRILSSSVLSTKSKPGPKRKSKKRSVPGKLQNSAITVNITNKKHIKSSAKHAEKKFKIEPVKMLDKESNSILSPKKSKKQMKKLKQNSNVLIEQKQSKLLKSSLNTDKLVELYHNTAAKGSESDSSDPGEHKSKQREDKASKIISAAVTHFPAERLPQTFESKPPVQYNYTRMLSPINEHAYSEPHAPRTDCFSTCSKNYELPTIASKMKQVAKNYMRQFNIHSIPFCAAKSTSPSHNIGINIQQVLSIIKTHQPITGISPTLAHNIGLAAEKLNTKPLSALMSSLSSRIGYGRSQCPLIRSNLNYQQLQEMAKGIPEEPCDEMEVDEETKIVQNDSMNGASGDTNHITNQSTMWTIDPTNHKNCTCVPQHGIGFQQVLNRYHANTFSTSTVSQMQSRIFRPRVSVTSRKIRQNVPRYNRNMETKPSSVLKGKEKNLKGVLTNLHDEFQALNLHYETLFKKVNESEREVDEETLRELEHLEHSLNKKEEEITMVMALYKEVVSLKQQVRILKEKASISTIAITHQQQQYRCRDYDTSAAVHLTKLLRQIQTYQEMYRIGRRN